MQSYDEFLLTKMLCDEPSGFSVPLAQLPSVLFPWQAVLVQWALKRGRAALFASTGLGKTLMQLSWAQHVPGRVLIVAPLAVTHQTIREAHEKLELSVQYVRTPGEMDGGISITNYDRLEAFCDTDIGGIVLDESSILKSISSKTRAMLTAHFRHIPYRLCCTATPAPNDIAEIANHAEFLSVMTRTAMLSTFFVHDDTGWRLRGHAQEAFFRWLASWSMALRNPQDLGYDGEAFQLPPLTIQTHFLPATWHREGELFASAGLKGIVDRAQIRAKTASERAQYAANLARQSASSVIIWTGLNTESASVMQALCKEDAREVTGAQSSAIKEQAILDFVDRKYRILISKVSICGLGLNLQHAHTAIFCGLSDSWEMWFQAIRRIWRYGQTKPVTIHVVLSEHEKPIWDNVQQKEQGAMAMIDSLISSVHSFQDEALAESSHQEQCALQQHGGPGWNLWHGDCIDGLKALADESIALSVFSPPFLALYQYSPTERDLGNCTSEAQFFQHFRFVATELLRVTQPGRLVAMHVSDVPAMQVRDGWIGLKNFSGHMVDAMSAWGWIYHGKYILDKDPQAQAIRIRAKGLAFKQLHKDAAWMRGALPDYVLLFRKPGENPTAIVPDVDNETWIEWAHPVWYSTSRDPDRGIRETHTLNAAEAREIDDDRHICPLALDLIERCVRLWSNPGETILDPFAGICSTGYVALEHGRQFVGCELKASYAETGMRNLAAALRLKDQLTLL